MSLLRDLVVTAGDAMRLSGDLMRYKIEAEKKAFKETTSRVFTSLMLVLTGLVLAGTGAGFLLYGVFVLVARATDSLAAAGLIVGFAILLLAGVFLLAGRSTMTRH